MWTIPSVVFWGSLGLVAYTYAGYPLLIVALARLRPRPVRARAIEPTVSVVLAAHNEEESISAKLENLLALDYPREKLQVIVASDGSTDRTESIVEQFTGANVELLSLPRAGKPTAINRGVERARGELVVLCDARQRIANDALRVLAPCFADPEVGAVVGDLQLGTRKGPGVYWAYERQIRLAESRLDSVVGGSGAFTAIRRELIVPLPAEVLLDDVYLPMQVVLQGYRVIHHPGVKVYDEEAPVGGEFARKARTLAGNYQLLKLMPELLNPLKNRVFSQYLSHKVLRLACPFALAGLLLSSGFLVASGAPPWPFYVIALGGQLAGYGLALEGLLRGERAGRVARVSHTFVTLNLAALEGLRRYIRGELAWTTVKHRSAVVGE